MVTCLGLPSVGCEDDIWILRLSFLVKTLQHKWHLASFFKLFGLPVTLSNGRSYEKIISLMKAFLLLEQTYQYGHSLRNVPVPCL